MATRIRPFVTYGTVYQGRPTKPYLGLCLLWGLNSIFLLEGCFPKKTEQPAPHTTEPQASDENEAIFGGKPSKLIPTEDQIYAEDGACANVTAEVFDAEDIPVRTDKDVTINLASNGNDTLFYSDSKCTTPIKSILIPKEYNEGGAFVKAPPSGSIKISFTDIAPGGLIKAETTISTVKVSELAFRGGGIPQSITECAPQAVMAQDQEGRQVVLAADVELIASSTSSTGRFYGDDDCKKEITASLFRSGAIESDYIYFKDSVSGTPTITIASKSHPEWKKATSTITVTAGTSASLLPDREKPKLP